MIIGQKEIKDLLTLAADLNLPTLLVGETGTGKTSLVRELAQAQDKPYTRFSITGETTVDDFVGKYILKDGETVWQDGILLTAVKQGHYLVVDEINAALPEILFVLHSLLDDDKYVIIPQKDNSTVTPHADFRFFATMNPVDEYAGTKELNKAFHSRFAMVLEVAYPNRATEVKILTSRTGVQVADARKMVDVAVGVRKAKAASKLFYTLSTRDLIYWGQLVDRLGLHRSFRVAIRNKGGVDSKLVEDIYTAVFTDYKRAEENGLETWLEEIKRDRKEIDTIKANINHEVTKEVVAGLQKEFDKNKREKLVLEKMEQRITDQIRDGLQGKPLKQSAANQALAQAKGA